MLELALLRSRIVPIGSRLYARIFAFFQIQFQTQFQIQFSQNRFLVRLHFRVWLGHRFSLDYVSDSVPDSVSNLVSDSTSACSEWGRPS